MSALTLKQLVYNQLKAEAPGFETELQFDHYISRTLHEMTNAELLDRISDALVELQKPYDRSLWL